MNTTLNLNNFKMNTLVAMVNAIGGVATVKTFSQRSKAVERLLKLAAEKNINLDTTFDADGNKIEVKLAAAPKVKAVKAPKEPKAPKVPKEKKISIRSVAEALLLKVVSEEDGAAVGLSYEDVLAEVKAQFPAAKTTVGCLRWYAVRQREAGVVLPKRARTAKPEAAVATPVAEEVATPSTDAVVEAPATEEVVA